MVLLLGDFLGCFDVDLLLAIRRSLVSSVRELMLPRRGDGWFRRLSLRWGGLLFVGGVKWRLIFDG
jgi:hypothetical protein